MTEPIKNIRGYEVLEPIARGGMGVVYRARQPALNRVVALKELAVLSAQEPGLAARFLAEARVAGSLNSPFIVSVHEFFEHEGVPYIAMEYLERGSLRPYVATVTEVQAIGALKGVLQALDHAEEACVVHRDVKPENVLVTPTGGVKLADFGIAKGLDALTTAGFHTATGSVLGTVNYMAPEQAAGQEVGPPADLYAVGAMAFEMLVGRLPFAPNDTPVAIMLHHVRDGFPPPASVRPELDERLAAWIQWMVAMDPRNRPQTARQAWDALEEVAVAMFGALWERDTRLGPVPLRAGRVVEAPPVAAWSSHNGASGDYRSYVPREHAAGGDSGPEPAAGPAVVTPPSGQPAASIGPVPVWSSLEAPVAPPSGWHSAVLPPVPAGVPEAPAPVMPPVRTRRRFGRRRLAVAGAAAALLAGGATAAATLAQPSTPMFAARPAIAQIRSRLEAQQPVDAVACPPRIPRRPGFTSRCSVRLAPGSQWLDAYITQARTPDDVSVRFVLR